MKMTPITLTIRFFPSKSLIAERLTAANISINIKLAAVATVSMLL